MNKLNEAENKCVLLYYYRFESLALFTNPLTSLSMLSFLNLILTKDILIYGKITRNI